MFTPYIIKSQNALDLVKNDIIRNQLNDNISKIEEYRKTCVFDFQKAFPILNKTKWAEWIVHERDFMFSTKGLHVMKTRYLFPNEPIQYCLLRIAIRLVGTNNEELLRLCYDLLSCCVLSVSSILAASSYQDKKINNCNKYHHSGEACQLHVLGYDYDVNTINQTSDISAALCMGVGIGVGASSIPSIGSTIPGKIRTGFKELCQKFEYANTMTMYERKPKTAIYLNICSDTCLEIFDMKIPAKSPLHNVFFGLFIPNLFMECVKNDEIWYLFSGETKDDNGNRLHDYFGDAFVVAYDDWVVSKRYTKQIRAKELMHLVVQCQALSGSPYIMWSDNINYFNNQAHLGIVKTSNLCAEIVNVATPEQPSSCTLISCNMAPINDHKIMMNRVYEFINKIHDRNIMNEIYDQFEGSTNLGICAKYAYATGYMAALIMNCFMGEMRKHRELGISPMGVQDMAFIVDRNAIDVCKVISEAMYRGSIQSSCHLAQNKLTTFVSNNMIDEHYPGSWFSKGKPQWFLRNKSISSDWNKLLSEMKLGMANSMLTAQAPTATTSLFVDNTESVLLAMDIFTLKESESGRFLSIPYGIMTKYMNYTKDLSKLTLNPNIDDQIDMYAVSAPFIDQSQSVMLTIKLTGQDIFDALYKTFKKQLKTGIYYFNFLQRNPTYQTVRTTKNQTENIDINCKNQACGDNCTL